MSKLAVKDFAAAINVPYNTVKSHFQRSKFLKDTEGLVDTDNETNRRYILEQTQGKGLYYNNIQGATAPKNDKSPIIPKVLTETEQDYQDIDLRKKRADAERSERESELKKIQLEKAAGNLLPVELVEKILIINIQNVFKTFEGELENIASIYNEVFGGTRTHLSDIIDKQRQILKAAIEKASEDSAAEVEVAIHEYQDVRSRGERK